MLKALIISLNFNPGHVSHLVASYKQCEELGYAPYYYVNHIFEHYLPSGQNILRYGIEHAPKVDVAIFLFPSARNLKLIWSLKKQGSRIIYIFHEPLAPLGEYRIAGFSYSYLMKLWIINRISSLTVKWSDEVLLPSKKAVELYENNPLYKNENYRYLPLMYDDERTGRFVGMSRTYFSYIGTVAADHSFQEYLNFVCWTLENKELPQLNFMIATKSTFEVPDCMRKSKRVKIQQGRPLTDDEINECYANSYIVWNAYARTTQSGVLAKSFMFGTPAIAIKKNCNEFAHDGVEVAAIDDNNSVNEIVGAIGKILNDYESFSANCRKRFISSFYYRTYNSKMKSILEK